MHKSFLKKGMGTFTNVAALYGAAAAAFTPASLSPNAWFEPAQGGMFQSNAGSGTGATANSDPIGYLPDLSGSGFHLTSAADTTVRPLLAGVGVNPYVDFAAASSQYLRRAASLGSYAAGAFTWAIVYRSNSPASSARVMAEGNSSQTNTVLDNLSVPTTTTNGTAFWRQDSGSGPANAPNGSAIPTLTGAMDGSDHVMLVTWNGTTITWYLDGTSVATATPDAGTFTLDQFALGALWRSTIGSYWSGRVYGGVFLNRVITSGERANLTTYLGNLAGLSL